MKLKWVEFFSVSFCLICNANKYYLWLCTFTWLYIIINNLLIKAFQVSWFYTSPSFVLWRHTGQKIILFSHQQQKLKFLLHTKRLITVDICSFFLHNCAPCRLHFLMKVATYNFLNHIIPNTAWQCQRHPQNEVATQIISLSSIVPLSNSATNFHWATFGRHK